MARPGCRWNICCIPSGILEEVYFSVFSYDVAAHRPGRKGHTVEYLHKDENPQIQKALTWGWFVGSLLISLVLGVAFANFFKGLEIASGGVYKGTLPGFFGPYALIGGVLFVFMSVTSGALWINAKTEGVIVAKTGDLARKSTLIVLVLALVYLAYSFVGIEGFTTNYSAMPALYLLPVLALLAAILAVFFTKKDRVFPAFCSNLLALLFVVQSGLASIYPYVLKSSVYLEYGIDIFEEAPSQHDLEHHAGRSTGIRTHSHHLPAVGIYSVQGKDKRNRTGRLLTYFLLFLSFLSLHLQKSIQL